MVDEGPPTRNVRRRYLDAPEHGDDAISVTVGEGCRQRTFVLHKRLATKHSQFFAAAFSKDWNENNQNHIKLKEDDPEYFEIFKYFIYTGSVFTVKDGDAIESTGENQPRDDEWPRLARCWVLGDKLLSTSFKDAITDAAIAKEVESGYHPLAFHEVVYRGSAGPCGMRRFLIDVVIWDWKEASLSESDENPDLVHFFDDLAAALFKMREQGRASQKPYGKDDDYCRYDDHGDDTPCYKTVF